MESWLAIFIVVITVVALIGNFTSFKENSKQKMRKQGLNDLKETLPRTNKSGHKMPPIDKQN
jgi:hypothetical protein